MVITRLFGLCMVLAASASASGAEPLLVLVPAADRPVGIDPVHKKSDVAVDLQIAPDGGLRCSPRRADDCPDLRRSSCGLLVDRMVLGPNVGKDGKAVPTAIRFIVRWLPGSSDLGLGGALPVAPETWITKADYPLTDVFGGTTTVRFTISVGGRIVGCSVIKSSGYIVLDDVVCRVLSKRAIMLPPLDAAGNRKSTSAQFSYYWPFGGSSIDLQ